MKIISLFRKIKKELGKMKKTLLAILAALGVLTMAVSADAPPVLDLGFEGYYSITSSGNLKDEDAGRNVVQQWGTSLSVTDEKVYDGDYALKINTTGNWGICAQVPNMTGVIPANRRYDIDFEIAGDAANAVQESLTVNIGFNTDAASGQTITLGNVTPAIDGSYTHFSKRVRWSERSYPVSGVELYVMGDTSGKIYYLDNVSIKELYENCNYSFEDGREPGYDKSLSIAFSDKAASGEKALELSYTKGKNGSTYYAAKSENDSIFNYVQDHTPFIYELSFKCAIGEEYTLPETLEWYFTWNSDVKRNNVHIFDQIPIEPDGKYKSYKLRFRVNEKNWMWENPQAYCIIKPQEDCKIYFDDVVIKKVYIADTEGISAESEGIYEYTQDGKFVPFEAYESGKTYAYNLVNIENNNPQTKSFSVVTALYDSGKLVSVNATPVNVSCEQVIHGAAAGVTVPATPGNYTVKGFKLDLDTMKPLQ